MIKKTATILMLAVAATGFSGIAAAQDNAEAAAQQQTQQPTQQQSQTRQLVQKLRKKASKLQKIHAQTLKSNPDLKQQQQDFVDMVQTEVKEQGYDIDAGKKRVKEMTKKLQSDDLSSDERKQIMQKFASERRQLSKARSAALQQPEIQKASKNLQQTTLEAMKAQNDNVEQLMQEMDQLRQKLRSKIDTAKSGASSKAPAAE